LLYSPNLNQISKKDMKKYIVVFAVIFLVMGYQKSFAQIDLFGGYGWQFGGKARFFEGDINIRSDWQWHIGLDANMAPGVAVRFQYSQMADADAEWIPLPGYSNLFPAERFKMDMHYFQLGAVRGMPMDNIEPYGLFTLGAAWFAAEELNGQEIGDVTRFAIALGGGIKIMPSDKFGFKLEARMLMPMYFQGVGLWAGTGGGGVSVGAAVPIVQGDVTAGLVLRLGS
jgi:opacity protein-like surface antigen